MFEEELPEEGEEVATHPQAGVAKKSSQVLVDIPPVAQEMKLSPPPAEPKLGGYISSVLSSMGSRDTGAKPGSRAFRPGMRKSLAAQRSRETRARPDDLSEAKPFMTALFEREEPPPPVREDLQKEERREDKVNGSSVLQQLMEVVTDWADEELNITMYLSLQVYRDKAARFEQWTQDLIVLQSQQFPGYKGTLIYRPDEAHQGSKTYYTYVIDVRYSGAKNLWRWLQSAQRVAVYSTAQAADLWDSSASMSHVHEGIVSAIGARCPDAVCTAGVMLCGVKAFSLGTKTACKVTRENHVPVDAIVACPRSPRLKCASSRVPLHQVVDLDSASFPRPCR